VVLRGQEGGKLFTKPMALATTKFETCTKVLFDTHHYYSSCNVPSIKAYQKMEKALGNFIFGQQFWH
jgi:hypothetical protein